ncbi:MAG: biopolymer transporter ExbD [Saprospiraceae bacterium]
MGLKKKSKVSPAFSMASLTDMIFLLLIFFILNSAVVALPSHIKSEIKTPCRTKVETDSKNTERYG